jgi:multiple antibiotic resistance protein
MAQALVSFFAIIDPLGAVLIFHLFTRRLEYGERLIAGAVACVTAFLMLIAFSLGGEEVIEFLGISPESFQVAAGLLLIPPAYRLVMEGQPGTVEDGEQSSALDFALVPLATPLIAGPGALAATASFAQDIGQGTTIAAFSLVLLLTLILFAVADQIFQIFGGSVLRVLARIVGILLFAIAVDFVLDGAKAFVEATDATASVFIGVSNNG